MGGTRSAANLVRAVRRSGSVSVRKLPTLALNGEEVLFGLCPTVTHRIRCRAATVA